MIIVGIEKSGNFVSHFEELDKREDGAPHFSPATYFLPTDDYIKKRVIYSDSSKRYGMDTYFGRKFLYKTRTRDILEWRRRKIDWTTMALLLVDLHGKRENSLSNQMRQTKAMSPQYAVRWWKKHRMRPPDLDPVEFMMKKLKWRYRKGTLSAGQSRIYLGDSRSKLKTISDQTRRARTKLLLTSPPYQGVTNYFYDQWLRLWLLGGPNKPYSPRQRCKRKFENKDEYTELLKSVFTESKALLARDAVIYVRTDARKFTYDSTIEALEHAFPRKRIRDETRSRPKFSQTALFTSKVKTKGEVDLLMW